MFAAAGAGWQYQALATERAGLERALADAERFIRRDSRPFIGDRVDPKARAEMARANAVAARLAVPWQALFADLEATSGKGVTLLGFEPEAGARRLRIVGEAPGFEDIAAYLRRLEASSTFRDAFLVSHELRDQIVGFTLSADWERRP
jgi:hypothetical protein